MNEKNLQAVYQEDLEILRGILEKLDILDQLKKGKLHCHICNSTLTMENLGCISSSEGQIILYCNQEQCLQRFKEQG